MEPLRPVVILDDDPLVVRALARTVESGGFTARAYVDARAALAALPDDAPDVIISDYAMPVMDGVAFLAEARRRAPEAARILCTAADDFAMAVRAVNAVEVFRIVAKPWHAQDLIATVGQASDSVRLRRENDRLAAEVRRQNLALREMNLHLEELVHERSQALLEGLIAALDFRDAETQWHSRRVSLYARRLARELGLGDAEATTVEHGALLHDIGKIGVRDHVLLKSGPLTADEWIEMQRHPELGWALLQRVEHLRAASVLVLQHQERWDGSGYPAGLKGEAIGIGARIFHVVDALDAITSERPYRPARPYDAARAEMIRCSGTQFDPAVVAAFLAVPPEDWERIRADVEAAAGLAPAPAAPAAAPAAKRAL